MAATTRIARVARYKPPEILDYPVIPETQGNPANPTTKKLQQYMTQEERTKIEERIVDVLKTVYDPEIPVNIYDLGLIYKIDLNDEGALDLDMTFTAPSCPAADFILEDVRTKVLAVEGVTSANVNMVFEPEWDKSMMTEEARVELGLD